MSGPKSSFCCLMCTIFLRQRTAKTFENLSTPAGADGSSQFYVSVFADCASHFENCPVIDREQKMLDCHLRRVTYHHVRSIHLENCQLISSSAHTHQHRQSGLGIILSLTHTLNPEQPFACRYILHPTLYTLQPSSYTPNPTPCTLHPTPYTLHPTSKVAWEPRSLSLSLSLPRSLHLLSR